MVGRVFSTAAGAMAALLLFSGAALAADPDDPAPASGEADEAQAPSRPLPRDDRKGNLSGFAAFNVAVPGGDLGAGLTLAQVMNAGAGFKAGLALGLSRYSALELVGQFVKFSASQECPACDSEMFAGGLGLTYHTSQALGFDPWVRFGAGFRSITVGGTLPSTLETKALESTTLTNVPVLGVYRGLDVASFSLGGDYYPIPWVGIGLFLAGDVGVQLNAPNSAARGAVYGFFQAGLRLAFEPQRKPVVTRPAAPPASTALVGRSDFGPALYNRAAR
jgi:hypothetical protein